MRNVCLKALVLALTFVGLAGLAPRTEAQLTQTLIQFTNTWRYDQSGRELGTAWRTNGYTPDAQWQQLSPGLFYFEPDTASIANYTQHAPFSTPLTLSSTVTTYYFRTTFTFNGPTNGVGLIATNLVDDGCAIWLNGQLAGSVRMPVTFNATTLASAGPATEGQLDFVSLANFLRTGANANTLAVEVHQSANTSSDVVFGMKLIATNIPTQLAINNQPDSTTNFVGDPVSFTVGVSGGPAFYQWQKGAGSTYTNIANANSATYTIPAVQFTNAGNYRVIVSNPVNTVTSLVATLTVFADLEGPVMKDAIVNNFLAGTSFGINTINVHFDDVLIESTARNTNNYQLISATNSNIRIPILTIAYNGSISTGVRLSVEGTNANWNPTNGSYYLIVNNVADLRSNNIAPNSVIGVSSIFTTNLTQISDYWYFHTSAAFDPDIYSLDWSSSNYFGHVTPPASFWWGNDQGILYAQQGPTPALCAGDSLAGTIDYQASPTLFRRDFTVPAGLPANGQFRLRYIVDDGLILYLNGVRIYGDNAPAGPVTDATRASTEIGAANCTTNLIPVSALNIGTSNKLGTNVLAAAVCQFDSDPADILFGLEMDFLAVRPPLVPPPTNRPPGTPTLVRNVISTPQGRKFVLSWPGTNYGYNLQYSTNIVGTASNWWRTPANWTQVPDQANPYTNMIPPTTGPRRFYRLFRETLN